MTRRIQPAFLLFAFLGSILLVNLILPICNLLLHPDWRGWSAAIRQPASLDALKISLLLSSFTSVVLMALLGVPLAYVLARPIYPSNVSGLPLYFFLWSFPILPAAFFCSRLSGQMESSGSLSIREISN